MNEGHRADEEGTVVVFPMASREGQIRRAVDNLMTRNGADADSYWKEMIAGMRRQLQASGLPDEAVGDELRAFARAVLTCIHEMHERACRSGEA